MSSGVETVKQSLNSIETNQGLFHSLNAYRHNAKKSFGIKNEGEVSRSIKPRINRDLNSATMHLLSKFGNPN